MTRKQLKFIIIFSLFPLFAFSQEYTPLYSPKTGYVTDLVLLYQGGKPNITYTPSHVKPYIFRQNSEDEFEWLFDSFLFLSGRHPNGKVFDGTWGKNSARQEEWIWLIDELFKKNQCLDAIETTLDSLASNGTKPIRKRKIVVSIPQPVLNQTDWGKVKGKDLNFTSNKDRLIATNWFVDEVLKSWKKSKFKHIELAGFYFFKENSKDDEELIQKIGKHVKSKKMTYYWIPYLWAPGFDKTHDLGFDVAYQQPNYFFKKSNLAPEARMDFVLNHAKKHNMGLEMEFNSDIQYVFFQMRFLDYLNWFEKFGVWDNASVAYYQDFQTFREMSLSNDPQIQILYEKLCSIINKRQTKADAMFHNDIK